ncbi:MAG: ACT domain-containing protein [Oscillospiraceae bacterium]|jgi:chorismate mutase
MVSKTPKYYIVEGRALPEIFLKVAEAKRILEIGEAVTVNEAAQAVGISRSAFYKYKDSVRPFSDMMTGRIITFQVLLKDERGVLSAILSVFAEFGTNILTINQSIPTDGCAAVTLGASTSDMVRSVEELLQAVSGLPGVIRFEILAG